MYSHDTSHPKIKCSCHFPELNIQWNVNGYNEKAFLTASVSLHCDMISMNLSPTINFKWMRLWISQRSKFAEWNCFFSQSYNDWQESLPLMIIRENSTIIIVIINSAMICCSLKNHQSNMLHICRDTQKLTKKLTNFTFHADWPLDI